MSFNPNIGIGMGVGYISAGRVRSVVVFDEIGSLKDLTINPRFSSIPITLSFYYGIPLSSILFSSISRRLFTPFYSNLTSILSLNRGI
ncbi:MAG: hypothetical protein R6V00_11180 [Candidatus Aminicenantes bacterium]